MIEIVKAFIFYMLKKYKKIFLVSLIIDSLHTSTQIIIIVNFILSLTFFVFFTMTSVGSNNLQFQVIITFTIVTIIYGKKTLSIFG